MGVVAKFTPAEDCSVDSEYTLIVNGVEAAGIQMAGRYFCANCWTGPDMEAMAHAREERTLAAAMVHAEKLLRKYGWLT